MITMWHNIQNEINSPQGHSSGVLIIFIEDGHIMSSLKDNKTCALLQQYLSYLTIVKGRSQLTAEEYRVDNNMLFEYVKRQRGIPDHIIRKRDFSNVDINFIKSISIADIYAFITYCGEERKATAATRARKIVSIRQFWKFLKSKAHLLLSITTSYKQQLILIH